ncbi:hypothetical protein [Halomonas sp. N3-2A]|uniref:hypothetical protein n=1 Tax=Halomonas sp. N3-2A TaxID=2014541 RepID=UPI000B5B494D|nr:hypothetical protein [Halomonas sp. N3-2A]ASK18434.1 hypothetical protein CEK60_03530 [Halomonas sp. N3-2A]
MSEQRERFEAWAVKPPREWCVIRQGERNIWPDQYCDYHVQCAWESWQVALPWTNVEDGLPDNGESVVASDGETSACGMYVEPNWYDLELTDRAGDNYPLEGVKRWMPLPE